MSLDSSQASSGAGSDNVQATDQWVRAAFEQSGIGLVLTDLLGVITYANEAFCRIVGHSAGEITGQTSHHITHPDDRGKNVDAIRTLREEDLSTTSYNKRYLRKDGEIVWTRVNLSLIRDARAQPTLLLATVEDITEQERARQALQEREEHLSLVFESVTDYAIMTIDVEGRVTSWNAGAQKIFGYSSVEILGRTFATLYTPEDQAAGMPHQDLEKARTLGRVEYERWSQNRSGTRFFASGFIRPMHEASGALRGFTKVCRDVTAQRQVEQDLAAARSQIAAGLEIERARLTEVFQRSPSFLAVLQGPDHVFELVNERYYQLVGHRDILHKPAREALPEIDGQGFFEILDRVYATGEPFIGSDLSVWLQREPGHPLVECFIDVVYQPMRDEGGVVSGIFAHGVEVTEKKTAERQLEQQARIFDTALSAIKDYVFIFDREKRFIYANKALLELWGLSAADAFGKSMPELRYSPEVELSLGENVDRVFESGKSLMAETPYTSPLGISGFFEYILSPVVGADGAVELVAGTSRNITDRKRADAEREQLLASERAARSEAERASRMKDEFLATLSHELRTPLNAIMGWASLLRHNPTAEDVTQGMEVIERNARAQTKIIEDLLDMSRIISGKVRLDVQRVELAPIVEAAIETVRPAAGAKGVRLAAVLDPFARPVSGDPNRLQQVFWNLLSNAVKFTPRGGRVQVVLERVNSHLEVSVIDTGEGISPEFLPHVFDRFRQADASTTRQHGGLGLGLAIVKQLVELHGGSVRVKSVGPGFGTTFTVALPLTVLQSEPVPDEERQHPREGAPISMEMVSCLRLHGVKVLVVDDEPDARTLVKRLLEDCDAAVRTAGSAAEAMELIRVEKPDVIVSDIGMPGEDGYALIRRVRALPAEQGGATPALALTAYARAEDRMRAIMSGFQMHVPKPVEPAELLAMVASLAGRTGA